MTDANTISRIHCLTMDGIPARSHVEQAEMACMGGANWIQLRVKNTPEIEWLAIAKEVKEVTDKFGAKLIINDNPHIAKAIQAAGVHLGKNDLLPSQAREILGPDYIIGGTANEEKDILHLLKEKVDYIGIGPYRFTSTKKNLSPVLGHNSIAELVIRYPFVPFIVIGGIVPQDIASILEMGAHGIAVSSAIFQSEEPVRAVRNFMGIIEEIDENDKIENRK